MVRLIAATAAPVDTYRAVLYRHPLPILDYYCYSLPGPSRTLNEPSGGLSNTL
jgi:hypothetical protein